MAVAALMVGIGIGAASNSSDSTAAATDGSSPATQAPTTVTVTEEVAGPTAAPETVRVTNPRPTKTVTVRVTPTPKPAISDDGIWLVGADIRPGTYRMTGGADCYWARLSDLSGGGIIANGLGANQIVSIAATDKAFETTRCGAWRPVR